MNKEEINGLHTQLKLLSCQSPVYPSQLREIDRELLNALNNVHQVLAHAVLGIHLLAVIGGCEEKFTVFRELNNDIKRLSVIDQCLLAVRCS